MRAPSISVVVACLLSMSSARAADMSGVREDLWELAGRELRTVLAQKYARVTRWELSPQFGSAHRQGFPAGPPQSVAILRTGVRSAVQLTWSEPDSGRQTRSLWFGVVGEEPVVVLQRSVRPGDALAQSDVALQLRNVLGHACAPVDGVEALQDTRATRAMRAGTIVCAEGIEPRPPVSRGETVSVRYLSERIVLVAKAIAAEDGQIGQRLRVMNSSSRESFHAVVSGASEVTVRE